LKTKISNLTITKTKINYCSIVKFNIKYDDEKERKYDENYN